MVDDIPEESVILTDISEIYPEITELVPPLIEQVGHEEMTVTEIERAVGNQKGTN